MSDPEDSYASQSQQGHPEQAEAKVELKDDQQRKECQRGELQDHSNGVAHRSEHPDGMKKPADIISGLAVNPSGSAATSSI
jgi:hypothetical protein